MTVCVMDRVVNCPESNNIRGKFSEISGNLLFVAAETILSNIIRKLLWFEISKMLIAVLKKKLLYCVVYYNFRHTFVSHHLAKYCDRRVCVSASCLSVHSHYLTTRMITLHRMSVACCTLLCLGPPLVVVVIFSA